MTRAPAARPIMKFTSSLFLFLASSVTSIATSSLPIVDLGYVQQQATEYNTTSGLYIYKNVRYARPPLGELRFRKPEPPLEEPAGTVSDGSQYPTTICPQSVPPPGAPGTSTPSANGFSEDCLFLDVYVPSGVNPSDDVPVLVWFYGGGYTMGSKDDLYINPSGLFRTAEKPMIFVALNYRLSAFGWASPPSEKTVVPNVGLYDARAALNWVQQYIFKFGGDAADVTVFGESAGGGIIMHTITAYGGVKDPPPFQKAIIQSPSFTPTRGNKDTRDAQFKAFMTQANCSDVACLRSAPTEDLMKANDFVNQNGSAAGIGFAVVVDGDYVPDLPSRLFLKGRYHNTLTSVIAANNQHEGLYYFPSPENGTIDDFNGFLSAFVPNMSNASQDAVRALYLDDSSQDSIGNKTVSLISDIVFTCNAQVIASSYAAHDDNSAFRYIFAVPPAKHGDDVVYTFYSYGGSPADPLVTNTTVASMLQDIITSLTISGVPESAPHTPVEKYGDKANVLVLNVTGVSHIGDPWKNKRCDFWQKADYVQG